MIYNLIFLIPLLIVLYAGIILIPIGLIYFIYDWLFGD